MTSPSAATPGAILIEDGTILPGEVSLQQSAYSNTWKSAPGLDARLAKSGWTFFYMAGTIQKHAFGFDEGKRVHSAVARVIKDVQSERCNCVEITDLTTKSFLGIPYVSVTAHARHVQDGSRFRGR